MVGLDRTFKGICRLAISFSFLGIPTSELSLEGERLADACNGRGDFAENGYVDDVAEPVSYVGLAVANSKNLTIVSQARIST